MSSTPFRHRELSCAKQRNRVLRCVHALGVSWALLISLVGQDVTLAAIADPSALEAAYAAKPECELNSARGDIKHVIYLQFGQLHFARNNPNVPSDLEQMPHLLKFIESNGMLLTNHHTVLPSEAAPNALAALTGLYPDHHRFEADSGPSYWTTAASPNGGTNTPSSQTVSDRGATPAPWVPFTRAGCNVGSVGIAKMALENSNADILNVFGGNSLEAALFADPSTSQRAAAEVLGAAIHCAAGNPICALGRPDVLATEPGGYEGFSALFGHKNVEQAVSPGASLKDLNGVVIRDAKGNAGFPGTATISAAQSLAYVAAMQEHGVPITYAYISPAHNNPAGEGAFGPGEAGYVAQLKAYDEAFENFLARLAAAGIHPNNTLFVVTSDMGGHFAGGAASPVTCDGVGVSCAYAKLGAAVIDLSESLARQDSKLANIAFDSENGGSAAVFLRGKPGLENSTLRRFQRAVAKLKAINPLTGGPDALATFLADPRELKLLHVLHEGSRAPSFVIFGNPDFYFQGFGSTATEQKNPIVWTHGGVAPEINTTFVGLVGPGVTVRGVEKGTWSDHTDVRPTMLALLGLKDDYATDGRVITEVFHEWALPSGVRDSGEQFLQLAQAYKTINAPVGDFGLTSLRVSTAALAEDAKYDDLQRQLSVIGALRDDMAGATSKLLTAAGFHGRRISPEEARQLTRAANDLCEYIKLLAANGW